MGKTLAYKLLEQNLKEGTITVGNEICVNVAQTLTQDSTGTMAYLQLEAMDIDQIATELSVAYIDHNMLQESFENADDHEFIKTVALKHGIIYSKPGNGICHQVHLERFAIPGKILIGSDSHTPTCGGLGMLSIGAGGLDIAIGMARGFYYLTVPRVLNVELLGQLKPWVSAKDIILNVLQQLGVKGGVGYIIEYTGPGVCTLSVEERATITNMGAELGATTSIFPSDEMTLNFLTRLGREKSYQPLCADVDAIYDKKLTIDLNLLTPLAAYPHSPDNVKPLPEKPIKVNQVAIGSCTNSSYADLMKLATILEGKSVHPDVSLVISPGSSTILKMLADSGAIATFIASGARILESGCGPCIGMGQAPKSGAVSLRTFNRNFKGRCGTMDADVYLVSVETAAASALTGFITDPRTLGDVPYITIPRLYPKLEHYFIYPGDIENNHSIEIIMGPNIKPVPLGKQLSEKINQSGHLEPAACILKTFDNVTTDDICPSNARLLPFRSNIPKLSEHCFSTIIPDFKIRCKKNNGGIIVGGENYGQGSSREHAALLPLYLGISAVLAKSFARIHKANLLNSGIFPLEFINKGDYETISENDQLQILDVQTSLESGIFYVKNITHNLTYQLKLTCSEREKQILNCGGYLNFAKNILI